VVLELSVLLGVAPESPRGPHLVEVRTRHGQLDALAVISAADRPVVTVLDDRSRQSITGVVVLTAHR